MVASPVAATVFPTTLLDFNGVLVDDEHVHLEAFRAALAPLGITVSDTDYTERYLGFDDRGAFHAILTDAGRAPSERQVQELIEAKKPLYLERAQESLKGFAGAAELVRRRAAAGPVAIVSGALRHEIELGLDVLGVRDRVVGIVSAEEATRSKPDPDGYHRGIALLARHTDEARARSAVVVEDSTAGVEAAKAAELTCVAVTHSYPAPVLERAGADLVVSHLDEITDAALTALWNRIHARP